MTSNDMLTIIHGRCPTCNKKLMKITPMVHPNDKILRCENGHMNTRVSIINKLAVKFHFYVEKPV